jgi:septum formation protein
MSKPNKNSALVLASASQRRSELLSQIGLKPAHIVPANIEETPQATEKPHKYAQRLSQEKARTIFSIYPQYFILAADTVVSCGNAILDKPENKAMAEEYLRKLSGRRHTVYGGITLITPENREITRLSKTIVQFKPLSTGEIDSYINSDEWEGKAGGYAIQGSAGAFVKFISGSYSNVVGLSLYDTIKILESGGYAFTHSK